MGVEPLAVALATITMFAIGMVWYSFVVGKQWAKINGFDKLDKKTQKELAAKMGPTYLLQLVVTIITAYVLAKLMALAPDYDAYKIALWVWIGLIVPTQVSTVLFGDSNPKYRLQRILILASESLLHTLAAVWVIGLVQ
jgi:hypothetical protein